jgi:hypothetical protein
MLQPGRSRHMTLPRRLAPEALDHLAAEDPAARHARRDLQRVHRVLGTRSILARGWQALVSTRRSNAPIRVLELGAGDGTLLLGVAATLVPAWPQVQLTLLDRQGIVSAATLDAYRALGWTATALVADVTAWAAEATTSPRWDLVSTCMFLHHFEGAQLHVLMDAIATRAECFLACEPHRGWLALAGSHCIGALGANAVTRQDAVLSLHAGFRAQELTARWPGAAGAWRCREHGAGLFSHCFSAQRIGTPA